MPIRRALKQGDPVFYAPDPSLYGEMEVREARDRGQRIVCLVDPDSVLRCAEEEFARGELVHASELAAAA